jgi:hypothetical protein
LLTRAPLGASSRTTGSACEPFHGQTRFQYDDERDKMHWWCKCGASYDYRSETVTDAFVGALESGRKDMLTSDIG